MNAATKDNGRGQKPIDETPVSNWQAGAGQDGAGAESNRARKCHAGERPYYTKAAAAGVSWSALTRHQVARRLPLNKKKYHYIGY